LTYYEILGVAIDASSEEIKKARNKQLIEFHPDRNKSPNAPEMLNRIKEIYEVLSDPQKRRDYDRGIGINESTQNDEKVSSQPESPNPNFTQSARDGQINNWREKLRQDIENLDPRKKKK
jgi:DnaJ-class molecular chaperone